MRVRFGEAMALWVASKRSPMRRIRVLLAPLCVCLSLHAWADEDWSERESRNGVTVAARPLAGSKVEELRGRMVVDFPAERVFAVLRDVESYPDIVPPTVVANPLRSEGENVTYYYMEIDPPVVARRYYCIRVERRSDTDGLLRSAWRPANDLCPEEERGKVRIEATEGEWTVRPLDEGHSEVVYHAHTDPSGAIPAWMVNRVQPGQLREIMESVRRASALPRYAPTPVAGGPEVR
jgi:START domain-containing protein